MDFGDLRAPALPVQDFKIGVIANAASGRCDPAGGEAVREALAAAGLRTADVWCGPGAELERGLERLLAAGPDLLVVLGGDGTIRTAAERCGREGPFLLPLPGGTMNLVPRALYGARGWRAILMSVLAAPAARALDGALAQGRLFLAAGIFGGPSLLAEAREAVRDGDLALAARRGVRAMRSALDRELICLWDDGAAAKGEAAAVLCPALVRGPQGAGPTLEGAVIDLDGPADALRLVLAAAFRDWRADPDVRCAKTARLEILGAEPVPALLDGERFTFAPPFRVEIAPAAVRVLAPLGSSPA
jgi:diacylglycerol kinase family enzyme